MTREEEIKQLRKFPRHYLWNKKRAKWTDEDVENLRNGIGEVEKKNKPKVARQPVGLLSASGELLEFDSVVLAEKGTGINANTIYAALNGRQKTAKGYQCIKINKNQQ